MVVTIEVPELMQVPDCRGMAGQMSSEMARRVEEKGGCNGRPAPIRQLAQVVRNGKKGRCLSGCTPLQEMS